MIADNGSSVVSLPSSTESEESADVQSEVSGMTIVRTNSPPVCKTTNDPEMASEVRELLNSVEKEVYTGEAKGGWNLKIDFADGTWYTLGGDMLNTDKASYSIKSQSAKSLYDELMAIYNAIDGEETKYTANMYQ